MLNRIQQALRFARQAHKGQVRKYGGLPYITHPIAVAELVREQGGDENQIMAALLHDVVEDTDRTLADISNAFNDDDLTGLIHQLTDVYTHANYPTLSRYQRKGREAVRLSKVSDRAKLVKRCDIAHNGQSIVLNDYSFALRYLTEKVHLLEMMGDWKKS